MAGTYSLVSRDRFPMLRVWKRFLPFLLFALCLIAVLLLRLPSDCWSAKPVLRQKPILFVGGVPRSGTTLMRAMLDAHPSVRCGEETRVVPAILTLLSRWEQNANRRLLELAGVTRHVLNDAVGAFIRTVVEQHGAAADLFCDKDPLALSAMGRLSEIFPHAKFILMLRDGRASVHSMVVRQVSVAGFNRTNKAQMLTAWNNTIARMHQQCVFLGKEVCLRVYYEKLILDPRTQVERICRFLRIPFQESMLEHEKYIGDRVRLSPREHSTSQVKRKLNKDALDSWVGFFGEEVLQQLDEIAPMLRVLGALDFWQTTSDTLFVRTKLFKN